MNQVWPPLDDECIRKRTAAKSTLIGPKAEPFTICKAKISVTQGDHSQGDGSFSITRDWGQMSFSVITVPKNVKVLTKSSTLPLALNEISHAVRLL